MGELLLNMAVTAFLGLGSFWDPGRRYMRILFSIFLITNGLQISFLIQPYLISHPTISLVIRTSIDVFFVWLTVYLNKKINQRNLKGEESWS